MKSSLAMTFVFAALAGGCSVNRSQDEVSREAVRQLLCEEASQANDYLVGERISIAVNAMTLREVAKTLGGWAEVGVDTSAVAADAPPIAGFEVRDLPPIHAL